MCNRNFKEMTQTTEISDYMDKVFNDMYVSEPPHYIILLEDLEVEGMVLKAGTYINGVRQDE